MSRWRSLLCGAALSGTLSAYGLGDLNATQRDAIWSVWYQLDAWSDFAPALAILRSMPAGSGSGWV